MWGALYCDAKAKGLYRDLWRAGMNRADFDRAFTFMANGCTGATPVGCYNIPNEDATQVLPKPPADQQIVTTVNAALSVVYPAGSVVDQQQVALQKIAAQIRKDPNMCAGIQTVSEPIPGSPVDELCVGLKVAGTDRCDVCQGNHVITCKTVSCPAGNPNCGCDAGNTSVKPAPRSYTDASDTWKRPGSVGVMSLATAGAPRSHYEPDYIHHRDKTLVRGRKPAQ
jgi:hypothetical protein